uniref:leucine--tRNA ligase n=1 Tax=Heterorhabditis bacteriophora TaxID=37862 RepID=A0A1I7WXZ6_HETBA
MELLVIGCPLWLCLIFTMVPQCTLMPGRKFYILFLFFLINGYGYYDSDTLDTFFDSSWQVNFLVSILVLIFKLAISAAVHLFFARFISYFLTDIGVTQEEEPFHHIIPQGVVRGKTYVERETGKYIRDNHIILRGDKMSKSKSNGVEETLRECYNYFVRNISMCLEVLHLHNTAISRLQGFTNALRVMWTLFIFLE